MTDSVPDEPADEDQIDPKEFLRALLRISPEDAKTVRERSPAPRKHEGQKGPAHDYGEDEADPS